MSSKNIFKISLGFFVFVSLILSTKVLAVEINPPSSGIILATVNIYNAKIVSQENNIFNISFDLSNNEMVQTGVKYGVKLVKETGKGQFVVDEKIYDESLNLPEHTKVNKEIVYEAPKYFSGEFSLVLISRNENGFPFASNSFAKVSLLNNEKGIIISPETCSLSIKDSKTTQKYPLNRVINLLPTESLILSCQVNNTTETSQSVTPVFETHVNSIYGEKIDVIGEDVNPIKLGSLEKKTFSIILPKPLIPQSYSTQIFLQGKDWASNMISVEYLISGPSATIENINLDKDYYKKGETANVTFVWRPSAESITSSTVSVDLLNNRNKKCANTYTNQITKNDFSLKIPLTITCATLKNPIVQGTVFDKDGNILSQKEFKFETTTSNSNHLNIFYSITILIIMILITLFLLRKKIKCNKEKFPISIIFLFFVSISLITLISPQVAKADTFDIYQGLLRVTASIDKDYYVAGETLTATGSVSTLYAIINEDTYGIHDIYLNVIVDGVTKTLDYQQDLSYPDNLSGSATYIIPRVGGTHQIFFLVTFSNSDGVPYSYSYSKTYDVVYRPTVWINTSKTWVSPNEIFSITWGSDYAEECFLAGGTISSKDLSGTISTSISDLSPTEYTLTCASGYGNPYYLDTASASVSVNLMTVAVYVEGTKYVDKSVGDSVRVTWDVSGTSTTSCTCECQSPGGTPIYCGGSSSTTSCGSSTGIVRNYPSTPSVIENLVRPIKFNVHCD